MKRLILLLILWMLRQPIIAQKTIIIYRNPKDSTSNLYELKLPKGEIKGLLALNSQNLSDTSNAEAYRKGIVLMNATSTTQGDEMMTEDKPLEIWNEMILEVVEKYNIPKDKIVVGGNSPGDVGAIRYA